MVTLGSLALALALQWVPVPGLSAEFRELVPNMSIGSLGVAPVVSAFVTVEWVALIVPPWRKLRLGAPGRRKLERASLVLAGVMVLSQAFGIGTWLGALEEETVVQAPVANPWIVVASLSGAVAFYVLLARLVDRRGMGAGLSVLLATLSAVGVVKQLLRDTTERPSDLPQILGLHALAVIFWAGVLLGHEKISTNVGSLSPLPDPNAAQKQPASVPVLRLPSSGSYPLSLLWWLMALPGTLAAVDLGFHLPLLDWLAWITASLWGQAFVLLLLASLAGWLQHQPTHMRTAESALGLKKKYSLERLSSASKRAALLSALLLLTLLLVTEWLGGNELGVDVLSLGLIVAVVADLVGEYRGTQGSGDYVPVAELHRVYVMTFVAEKLEAEQIPFVVRGLCHRTFGQFFAPFVPMTILVRKAQATRARALIGEVC